jgi:iron complex outermembrane receptor protein
MNSILKGKFGGLSGQLSLKYVGDYFSDNYDDDLITYLEQYPDFVAYSDNKVDSYFVVNFLGSYDFKISNILSNINVFVQVNNIFDALYASYATGGDFFPAAERNFLAGIKLGI